MFWNSITDYYDITSFYCKKIKEKNFNLLSIDDSAQIHYYSDIVINQNLGSDKLKFSSEKYTKFLLGPKYVMLRDDLLKWNKKKRIDKVQKLLLTMGGSDNDNYTLEILKTLKAFDENLEIILVIGPLNPFYNELKEFVKNMDIKVKLIKSPKKIL